MNNSINKKYIDKSWHGTFRAYLSGFIWSILLTLAAFFIVDKQLLTSWILVAVIIGLALVQFAVQLISFLHLGKEEHPRWNMLIFFFMSLIVLIIVSGTLWIMYSLDSRTMITMDVNAYMQRESGM